MSIHTFDSFHEKNQVGRLSSHLSYAVSDRYLYVFSGHSWVEDGRTQESGVTNMMWIFDTYENLWSFKRGSTSIDCECNRTAAIINKYTPYALPSCKTSAMGSNVVIQTDDDYELFHYGGLGKMIPLEDNLHPLHAFWSYSTKKNQWKALTLEDPYTDPIYSAGGSPGSRMDGTLLVLGDNNIWLHAGRKTTNCHNDVWKYDIALKTWSYIHGNKTYDNKGVYGTLNTFGHFNVPSSSHSFMAWSVGNHSILKYGGYNYNAVRLNQLWLFHTSLSQWKMINGDCDESNTYGSTFSTYGSYDDTNYPGSLSEGQPIKMPNDDEYVMIGGRVNGFGMYDEVSRNWVVMYSISRNEWKIIGGEHSEASYGNYKDIGQYNSYVRIGGRTGHTTSLIGSKKIYIIGGYGLDAYEVIELNDVFEFNVAREQFKYVYGWPHNGEYPNFDQHGLPGHPSVRQGAYMVGINDDKFLLFGGSGEDGVEVGINVLLNDLWEYSIENREYIWLSGSAIGGSYSYHGSYYKFSKYYAMGARKDGVAVKISDNEVLFHGGWGREYSGSGDYLSSLYVYNYVERKLALFFGGGASNFNLAGREVNFGVFNDEANPGSRVSHIGMMWKEKYYVFFGGISMDNVQSPMYRDDIFIYDIFDTLKWKIMIGSDYAGTPIYPGEGSEEFVTPGGLRNGMGWIYNDHFYIFGGKFEGWGLSNNMWKFDLNHYSTNSSTSSSVTGWYYLSGSKYGNYLQLPYDSWGINNKFFNISHLPWCRENAAFFQIDNLFYIFGGKSYYTQGEDFTNDLWVFNAFNDQGWMFINGSMNRGMNPPYIHGFTGKYGELHVSKDTNRPGCRKTKSFAQINGKFVIFGGYGYRHDSDMSTQVDMNDLWFYKADHVCFGYSKDDLINVCSGHGSCVDDSICHCNDMYYGEKCEINLCFDQLSNATTSCSSHGICKEYNKCSCNPKYYGDECESHTCFGLQQGNPNVCNGHGACSSLDICSCNLFLNGETCDGIDFVAISLAIVSPIGLIICILLLVFLIFCLLLCRKRINKFAIYFKAVRKLDDIDLLIEEQELDNNSGDIAHLKINKSLFEIESSDLQIEKSIGQGCGNSVVYRCKYKNSIVAFKCFKIQDFLTQDKFNEFEREASLLANLNHPHVIFFYGCILKPPRIGVVMEYCKHGDLQSYVEKNKLKIGEKLSILKQICSGMAYLHSKNVIHRDLKCQNVLIDDKKKPKIMDFGISRMIENVTQTKTKRIGTSYHMAPEVTLGEKYDSKCDVFSFSMMAFEFLSQNFEPFGSVTFSLEFKIAKDKKFRPRIEVDENLFPAKWIIDMIKSCWEQNPKDRPSFQDVFDLIEKNENIVSETGSSSSDKMITISVKVDKVVEKVEIFDFSVFGMKKGIQKKYKGKEIKELSFVNSNKEKVILHESSQLKDIKDGEKEKFCVVVEFEKDCSEIIKDIKREIEDLKRKKINLSKELEKLK